MLRCQTEASAEYIYHRGQYSGMIQEDFFVPEKQGFFFLGKHKSFAGGFSQASDVKLLRVCWLKIFNCRLIHPMIVWNVWRLAVRLRTLLDLKKVFFFFILKKCFWSSLKHICWFDENLKLFCSKWRLWWGHFYGNDRIPALSRTLAQSVSWHPSGFTKIWTTVPFESFTVKVLPACEPPLFDSTSHDSWWRSIIAMPTQPHNRALIIYLFY